MINIYKSIYKKNHPFQLLELTYIPLMLALFICSTMLYFIILLDNKTTISLIIFYISILCLITIILKWFTEMSVESKILFIYNKFVEKNILMGVSLFIISEIFLFLSIFWSFFHSSLNPSIFIGSMWPPIGIEIINPWTIPFLNTLILVISGITVNSYYYFLKTLSFSTNLFNIINFRLSCLDLLRYLLIISHINTTYCKNFFVIKNIFFTYITSYNLIKILWKRIRNYLIITISLGFLFMIIQYYEYINLTFSLSDSIYGSIFYLSTGVHGFHVLLGLLMLFNCLTKIRIGDFDYNSTVHISSTSAVWYWHFVDVVWLFLFIFVYIWSN